MTVYAKQITYEVYINLHLKHIHYIVSDSAISYDLIMICKNPTQLHILYNYILKITNFKYSKSCHYAVTRSSWTPDSLYNYIYIYY